MLITQSNNRLEKGDFRQMMFRCILKVIMETQYISFWSDFSKTLQRISGFFWKNLIWTWLAWLFFSMCKHSVHCVNQTIYWFSLVYCNCRHYEKDSVWILQIFLIYDKMHIIIWYELILLEHIIKAEQNCLHYRRCITSFSTGAHSTTHRLYIILCQLLWGLHGFILCLFYWFYLFF